MTDAKKRGRPSSFRPEYIEQARKLCLLGATNPELANFFGVATSTVDKWIKEDEDFSGAVKSGRLIADSEVACKLYERAVGAEWEEEQVFKVRIDHHIEEVQKVTVKRAAPPDTAAAFIWLKNRQPKKWRDKSAPEDDEAPPPVKVVVNVIDASIPDAES